MQVFYGDVFSRRKLRGGKRFEQLRARRLRDKQFALQRKRLLRNAADIPRAILQRINSLFRSFFPRRPKPRTDFERRRLPAVQLRRPRGKRARRAVFIRSLKRRGAVVRPVFQRVCGEIIRFFFCISLAAKILRMRPDHGAEGGRPRPFVKRFFRLRPRGIRPRPNFRFPRIIHAQRLRFAVPLPLYLIFENKVPVPEVFESRISFEKNILFHVPAFELHQHAIGFGFPLGQDFIYLERRFGGQFPQLVPRRRKLFRGRELGAVFGVNIPLARQLLPAKGGFGKLKVGKNPPILQRFACIELIKFRRDGRRGRIFNGVCAFRRRAKSSINARFGARSAVNAHLVGFRHARDLLRGAGNAAQRYAVIEISRLPQRICNQGKDARSQKRQRKQGRKHGSRHR